MEPILKIVDMNFLIILFFNFVEKCNKKKKKLKFKICEILFLMVYVDKCISNSVYS